MPRITAEQQAVQEAADIATGSKNMFMKEALKKKPALSGPHFLTILKNAKTKPALISQAFFKKLEKFLADAKTPKKTITNIYADIKGLLGRKKIDKENPRFALQKVLKHAELLTSKKFEEKPMSEREALHLACGIKNQIDKVQRVSPGPLQATSQLFLQKANTRYARDVHIIGQTAHVISRKALGKGGTYKVPYKANALALDRIQKDIELSINLRLKEIKPEKAAIEKRAAFTKDAEAEMNYQMQLQGPGIAGAWGVHSFKENLGRGRAARQISIMVRPAVALEDFEAPDDEDELLDQNKKIADQVLTGLERCHKAGVIHLDLKAENVNIYVDEKTGKLTAGVADFGFAFEPAKRMSSNVMRGSSGTAYYTPHELWLNEDYVTERVATLKTDLPKVDMYAFGCLLYERHFVSKPPGFRFIDAVNDECWIENPLTGTGHYDFTDKTVDDEPVTRDGAREKFADAIGEEVEAPLKKLLKKEVELARKGKELSENEKFEKFIYSCMRLKPEDRLSTVQARKLYNKLFLKV